MPDAGRSHWTSYQRLTRAGATENVRKKSQATAAKMCVFDVAPFVKPRSVSLIFYHFTSRDNLPSIERQGLNQGDVAIAMDEPGLNAVWLTTDRRPRGHGLEASVIPEDRRAEYRRAYARAFGRELPEDFSVAPGKLEVRIAVKLRDSDRQLKRWLPWSQGRVDPTLRQELIESGGGKRVAETWRIYFGVIHPRDFIKIDDLDEMANTQARVNRLNERLLRSGLV